MYLCCADVGEALLKLRKQSLKGRGNPNSRAQTQGHEQSTGGRTQDENLRTANPENETYIRIQTTMKKSNTQIR